MGILKDMIISWDAQAETVNTMEEIEAWLKYRSDTLRVVIRKIDFLYDGFWFYDEGTGMIRNKNDSFFKLSGYRESENGKNVLEQTVIIQDEIGYLGIICKKINGVLHFLMQAKIEPGNVNTIQLSPTIQATRSNFTRRHGGKAPAYLDYFLRADRYPLILDQIQSEQSSRFYRKRNRNIMILVDEEIEVLPSHMWMTLNQIKQLMTKDNLVNMDTRTVLSCIPFSEWVMDADDVAAVKPYFKDQALYASMFKTEVRQSFHRLFHQMNNAKMFSDITGELIPLKELRDWEMTKTEIVCRKPADYKIICCDIEIEGREVQRWQQPLVEANGMMMLGLFTRVHKGVREFLVKLRHEPGCFDTVEWGPTVQLEPTNPANRLDMVEQRFIALADSGKGILKDVILSEEGGRFYHEENRNLIIEIAADEELPLPYGYAWSDFRVLNRMLLFNNYLNIQLRNLLSLLDL